MPTDYGFAGQHADSTTGLDYFNARYYDPLAGQFTSADTTLSGGGTDPWALSRYAYVEGDPLVRLDPSGHNWLSSLVSTVTHVAQAAAPAAVAVLDATTGIPSMINDVHPIFFSNASPMDKIMAGADLLTNAAMDASMVVGVGEGLRAAYVGVHIAEHVAEDVGEHALAHAGEDALAHAGEDAVAHAGEDAVAHAGEDAVAHTVEHEAESEAEHASEHAAEDGAAQGRKTYVIGENMEGRVKPYAKAKGYEYWKSWKKAGQFASREEREADELRRDVNWIKRLRREDQEIVDIGRDPERVREGRPISPFLQAERDAASGYSRYRIDPHPIW